jgi:hypothetical protein
LKKFIFFKHLYSFHSHEIVAGILPPPHHPKIAKKFSKNHFAFTIKSPDLIKEGAGTAGIASSWPSQQLQPPFKGRFFCTLVTCRLEIQQILIKN